MGILLHALAGMIMTAALFFHPYPWTTFIVASVGGYLREQQYVHGKNKMRAPLQRESSWALEGSTHKWLEAFAWGVGAGALHLTLWLLITVGRG